MAFTVADVVLAARDLSPAYTPQRHPDVVCWRFLSRYSRTLMGRIVQLRPAALPATVTSVPLPLGTFGSGVPVPNDLLLVSVSARPVARRDDSVRVPVELLPAGQRLTRSTRLPWAVREGAVVFLSGTAADWTAFDQLELRTVAMPTAFANGGDTVPLPDDALDVCAEQLGAFLASRVAQQPDGDKVSPRAAQDAAAKAEASFLARLTNQGRAEVITMRRVYS